MPESKPPIPLDYKTPEMGEPVTAMTVVKRVMVGFCGMLALIVALILITAASLVSIPSIEIITSVLVVGIPTCIATIFGIRWLKYAIVGIKKSPGRRRETNNKDE